MNGQRLWWPLRKAYRLFFDDWHLSLPILIWLASSLVFSRSRLAAVWHATLLFGGFAAILLGASLAAALAARTGRSVTPTDRRSPTHGANIHE